MSGVMMGFAGGAYTVIGQQAYTTAGTYSWIAPAGVTSVSVVAVGGGGSGSANGVGGGGAGLRYRNNISVTPGNSYTVVVGAAASGDQSAGGNSSFDSVATLWAQGGQAGTISGTGPGGTGIAVGGSIGGGNGGTGRGVWDASGGGPGGAGGYSGNGGDGAPNQSSAGSNGTGGGGGGGGGGFSSAGGVGLLGQGANGVGGSAAGIDGTAGSGGSGVLYGGGTYAGSIAGRGAVRIIWPGTTRSFPSTNTGDL